MAPGVEEEASAEGGDARGFWAHLSKGRRLALQLTDAQSAKSLLLSLMLWQKTRFLTDIQSLALS